MKTSAETALPAFAGVLPVLENISGENWNEENIHAAVFAEIEKLGVKNGWVLLPMRAALSGKAMTPGGGIELAAYWGKTTVSRALKKLWNSCPEYFVCTDNLFR